MPGTVLHVQDRVQDGTGVGGCVESRELGRRSSTDVDALHAVDVLEAVEVR